MKKDYNMSQMVSSPDFSEEEIMERRRFKEFDFFSVYTSYRLLRSFRKF